MNTQKHPKKLHPLRLGVTRKASTGAGSYTVTRLHLTPACVCAQVRMRVCVHVRLRNGCNACNRVTRKHSRGFRSYACA